MPLAQRTDVDWYGGLDVPESKESIVDSRRSMVDVVRAALARGINVQLKRRNGSMACVYPPVVIAAESIQFQSTAGVAQKPMILGFDEIVAVQPR